MSAREPAEEPDRSEEEQERLNRQMTELLNELRVALPGVQVLFAFLLAVPFAQGFEKVDAFQRDVYFVTLLASAAFQTHDKPRIIRVGTVQFICGLAALAVAMNGAVLLVTDVLFQATTVVVTLAITCSLFAWLWFGIGVWRRMQR